MRGKAALIGFLLVEVALIALWATSLASLMGPNAPPFISDSSQIWSGGGYTSYSDNFRQRSTGINSAPFQLYGPLLYATLLLAASAATAVVARTFFVRGKGMIAAGALVATLALGAGAAWFIATQWEGGTFFPPHTVNTGWLYTATRTFLIDMGVGYVAVVAYLGLVIADVSKDRTPLGFNFAVLNWLLVVVLWIGLYVGLFVLPSLGAPPAAA